MEINQYMKNGERDMGDTRTIKEGVLKRQGTKLVVQNHTNIKRKLQVVSDEKKVLNMFLKTHIVECYVCKTSLFAILGFHSTDFYSVRGLHIVLH